MDKAIDALKANPINAGARIEWTPARVSVSGDGRHGFTAGFMTLHRIPRRAKSASWGPGADQTTTPLKYLGYWEKQKDGWRLAGLQAWPRRRCRRRRWPCALCCRSNVAPATDAATIERYRESLAEAERSFSRDAQTMGIGPRSSSTAIPKRSISAAPTSPPVLLGNEQIARAVGSSAPPNTSPVNWGPEKTIVAASGDFGVTIGYIVQNKPGPDGKIPPGQPFFTIWKRSSPKDRWLYIAE